MPGAPSRFGVAMSQETGLITCWVCEKSLPALLGNEHHVHPREAGGSDDPSNKKWLDPSCHQNLHRLADMLLANKAGQAKDVAAMAYPVPAQRERVMFLAGEAAKHIRAFEEYTPIAARKDVTISFDCDTADYMKLKALAADLRSGNRRASVPSVCRMIIAAYCANPRRFMAR